MQNRTCFLFKFKPLIYFMRLFGALLLLLPLFCTAQVHKPLRMAQRPLAPCSLPGMTPESAIAVCGITTFRQNDVSSCEGPPISGTGACGASNTSDNAFWYKFHCYQPGTLGFTLRPLVLSDDYDWEIFDITNVTSLAQLYTDESLMISLNLCGSPNGITGCTSAGTDSINCGGATSLFNRLATLKAGHDYLLMVNNWSNSGQGYTLTFGGGTAVITDNTPPVIASVAANCNATALSVNFSKDIKCTSVSGTGSEFSITPGTHTITGITSQCAAGYNNITGLTVNLQNQLAPGNYTLLVNPGSDGNTFADPCDELMVTGFQIPFTVPAVNAVEVDTITYTGCVPNTLHIKLTRPVWCSSVTATGSEFTVLPGINAIASVQSVCAGGLLYTDMLHLNMQTPLPPGSYQLVINAGTDGNVFIDTCNNNMAAPAIIPFDIPLSAPPLIQAVVFNECYPDKVVVHFDKPVDCASISAAATEFVINPGNYPVAGVSYNCTVANYVTAVTINLQVPLPAGNFDVIISNGADGNTVSDTCQSFIPATYSKSFITTQAPLPKIDSVQFDKCNPAFIKLFYSKPVKCTSVSADGSDYTVTGPSAVTVTAAVTDVTCAAGYTSWVLLQFAQPVNVFGNYRVHNKNGTDGNGIVDTCNAEQDNAETVVFNAFVKPSALFSSQVKFGCSMDTVTVTHAGGNGITLWNWTFTDGTSASGQTVTHLFPVTTAAAGIQLVVSNGHCSDTAASSVILNNAFNALFSVNPTDTACINVPVSVTNQSTGSNLQYLWSFGDNTHLTGQAPPAHLYSNGGQYTIRLIAADAYGCTDTAVQFLQVMPQPFFDFTGLGAAYCSGKTVSLQTVPGKTITDYTWNNGNGLTVKNKPAVQFTYTNQQQYTVTLSGTDKYCGAVQAVKTTMVYAVPDIRLGNDTVLCPAVRLQIGVPFINGYTYQWSTGAATSYIFTDIFTSTYSLTADNNGCKATDAIAVKVLPACLIKVPNAFTPNNDGVNDKLYAVNADLAKDFSFRVYNRFGVQVFSSSNPLAGWDGTFRGVKADAGAYVWILNYTDPWAFKTVNEKGSSILIR
jgi:gliding motility-associated-like protein